MTWTLHPPVFIGGRGQMDVPQVFRIGARWDCLCCTSSFQWSQACRAFNTQTPVTGSHYLVAGTPRGPWTLAPGPFLAGSDPCRRYAARIMETPDGRRIMGFAHGATGQVGGYVMDPDPVTVDQYGQLHVTPTPKPAKQIMADIKLTLLKKSFGAVDIIKGVDIDIKHGAFVVFVGPPGCGVRDRDQSRSGF